MHLALARAMIPVETRYCFFQDPRDASHALQPGCKVGHASRPLKLSGACSVLGDGQRHAERNILQIRYSQVHNLAQTSLLIAVDARRKGDCLFRRLKAQEMSSRCSCPVTQEQQHLFVPTKPRRPAGAPSQPLCERTCRGTQTRNSRAYRSGSVPSAFHQVPTPLAQIFLPQSIYPTLLVAVAHQSSHLSGQIPELTKTPDFL